MISIIRHIQYLILRHDCVVVPGLGAFVSRNIGATISPDGFVMTPPYRELSFNSLLTHDDGMLIDSVCRREGVSYECARGAVEQEVELIRRRLRNEGSLQLQRIGRFTLTEHGSIDFAPDTITGIYTLPYYGLQPLNLTPVASDFECEAALTTIDINTCGEFAAEENQGQTSLRARIMPALRYAATAAVLVGACLTLLTPISAPEGLSLASLQPHTTTIADQPTEVVPDPAPERFASRTIELYRPDPTEATATVYPKTPPTTVSESSDQECPRYYVIVASTVSRKEANRYVKAHSTAKYKLRVLPSDGRYRVYAACSNDFNAMSAYRHADPDFAAANPNAWVYTLTK